MRFKWNKIRAEGLNSLSSDDKSKLLAVLLETLDGKKPSSSIVESELDLSVLLNTGLITVQAEKEMYWQDSQWYLIKDDFDKLQLKYGKAKALDGLERFKKWKSPSKLKRTDCYLSINRWLKDDESFVLTEDMIKIMQNSFNVYIDKSGVDGDYAKYCAAMQRLFEKGETVDDVRAYLNKEMIKQLGYEKGYRALPENILKGYDDWKKWERR